MKSRLHLVLSLLLAVMAGELLVACESKNGSGSPASPAAAQPGQPGQPPVPKNPDGTSDSGGGTGVDDKVFESYIVDPTTLPAYREHLASLFTNIQSAPGREQQNLSGMFRMKTWYIAPVELDRVGKDALGVVFMKSDTQQLARQTLKEIWIDKRIFDRMAEKDQAELLLHELVMNMYMMKFVKMSELCRMSDLLGEKKDEKKAEEDRQSCRQYSAYLDQVMPAEKPAPLTEHDNENIRYATGWLLRNARQPIAELDFVRMLNAKGFDKRIYSPENYMDPKERAKQEKKINRKELLSILRAAKLTDNMPELCTTSKSERSKACGVELIEKEVNYSGHGLPGLMLRVSVEGETPIELTFITADELPFSVNSDYEGGVTYSLAMTDALAITPALGQRIHFGFLIFREENAMVGQGQMSLAAITLTPGIITANDREGAMVCEARSPRAVKFTDESMFILRPDRAGEKTARMFSAIAPIAICAKPVPKP